MNFFQSIIALQVAGNWTINIDKADDKNLVVSVRFYNNNIGDEARKKIPPLILRGTPEEMDEGFFQKIEQPIKTSAQLLTNMEQYLKQQEQAKVSSQMNKEKQGKAEKEKTDKDKKYEEGMKKADELEAEGKYREAWMKVPDIAQYPEHEEEIRARKSELSKQFAPTFFND